MKELADTELVEPSIIQANSTEEEEPKSEKFLQGDGRIHHKGHTHPVVQGNANQINLEVRGNNDYFGPLFVG